MKKIERLDVTEKINRSNCEKREKTKQNKYLVYQHEEQI